MNRRNYPFAIVLALLTSWTCAAEHPPKADDAQAAMVPLIENLGDLEHQITTSNPLAQKYFNQGLRLIFAFNHDEAIRAFQAVAKLDPKCAMARWGIAISLGPNYNVAAEKERAEAAYKAVREAQQLLGGASPRDAAYIEALSKRYDESPDADRKVLDTAYADAMRKLAAQFPDDPNAAVLFAEAMMDLRPWDLWTPDGQPQPGTLEILSVLEAVLEKHPNHPGANHFYIHAVEASRQPERGLPSALRLGGLMPGAGHLVHMPSHIYFRLGRYSDAVESNKRAVEVDKKYIETLKPEGVYPMMYYPHNIHFLWAALCIEGRGTEAVAAANQVVQALSDDMVKEMPMLEYFVPVRLYTLVRFRKWDEIPAEKPPLADFKYATGMWHYAQGLASTAKGQSAEAEDHYKQLISIQDAMPEDMLVMRHPARRLLGIAAGQLGATIDAKRGDIDVADKKMREAIALQDGLQYDEPPPWFCSTRQALGVLLLDAKRPEDALAAFREDLQRQPENGWSLRGLELALRALDREMEAAEAHTRFEKAWARADAPPP